MWRDIPAICQTCQEAEEGWEEVITTLKNHSVIIIISLWLFFNLIAFYLSAVALHFQCLCKFQFQFQTFFKSDLNFSSQKSHPGQRAASRSLTLPPALHSPAGHPDLPGRDHGSTSTPAAGQRIITRQLYNNARPLLTLLQPAIIIPAGAGGHLGVHMVWLKKAGKVRDWIKGLISDSFCEELQYLRARAGKWAQPEINKYKNRRKSSVEAMTPSAVWFGLQYVLFCGGRTLLEHVTRWRVFSCFVLR